MVVTIFVYSYKCRILMQFLRLADNPLRIISISIGYLSCLSIYINKDLTNSFASKKNNNLPWQRATTYHLLVTIEIIAYVITAFICNKYPFWFFVFKCYTSCWFSFYFTLYMKKSIIKITKEMEGIPWKDY